MFFFFLIILFIYLLAVLGLGAAQAFSLVAVSRGCSPVVVGSLQWLPLLQSTGSRACGLQ